MIQLSPEVWLNETIDEIKTDHTESDDEFKKERTDEKVKREG